MKSVIMLAVLFALPSAAATDREWTEAEKLLCRTQERLNELEWNAGTADGRMGPRTQDAIRRYQQFTGLEVTGEPSATLLNGLLLPCQIAMTSDWYTGESTSQAQFGCKSPQVVTNEIASVDLNSPKVQTAQGPTCGRARCSVTPSSPSQHASLPLRYDGTYFERLDGMRRVVRFYPDGTVAITFSAMTTYEAPCEMSAQSQHRSGNPPRSVTVEGDQIRWEVSDPNRVMKFSARAFEGRVELGYEGNLDGQPFTESTLSYEFVPDPR